MTGTYPVTSSPSTADAGRTAPGVRRAVGLSRPVVLIAVLVVAVLVAIADQLTKRWALAHLQPDQPRALLGEILQLRLIFNSGAAWGLGAGVTPVVTLVQLAICVGAILFAARSVRSVPWTLAIGLVVGGALGNIHDRLLRAPGPFRGEVVDFLQLPHWPIFNVADAAVVAGAILVVLLGILGTPTEPGARDGEAAAARSAARERRA